VGVQVFEGVLTDAGKEVRVVLKRVKPRVTGAETMVQMEHMMNCYVSSAAKGSCAPFLGYLNVSPQEASGRMTQVCSPTSSPGLQHCMYSGAGPLNTSFRVLPPSITYSHNIFNAHNHPLSFALALSHPSTRTISCLPIS
jgi:hypothetical protein